MEWISYRISCTLVIRLILDYWTKPSKVRFMDVYFINRYLAENYLMEVPVAILVMTLFSPTAISLSLV